MLTNTKVYEKMFMYQLTAVVALDNIIQAIQEKYNTIKLPKGTLTLDSTSFSYYRDFECWFVYNVSNHKRADRLRVDKLVICITLKAFTVDSLSNTYNSFKDLPIKVSIVTSPYFYSKDSYTLSFGELTIDKLKTCITTTLTE